MLLLGLNLKLFSSLNDPMKIHLRALELLHSMPRCVHYLRSALLSHPGQAGPLTAQAHSATGTSLLKGRAQKPQGKPQTPRASSAQGQPRPAGHHKDKLPLVGGTWPIFHGMVGIGTSSRNAALSWSFLSEDSAHDFGGSAQ